MYQRLRERVRKRSDFVRCSRVPPSHMAIMPSTSTGATSAIISIGDFLVTVAVAAPTCNAVCASLREKVERIIQWNETAID